MLYASDLVTQYIPWYWITSQYLHHFQLPVWVPNIYGSGYPLLAEGEIGTLSPINSLILFVFPFVWAINLLYLIYFLLAFFGSYFFLKINKLSSLSSSLGALIFCLSGFMVTRYFQPSIIFTAALIPTGFFLIQKSISSPKLSLFIALLIYLEITAGHLQIALISIIAYLAIAFFLLIGNKQWYKLSARITLAVLLGLTLSAIQILPSLKLYQLSERKDFNPAIRFSYSLPPSQLITYLKPYAFGISKPGDDLGFRQFGGGFWEINLTIWTVPFLLSLVPLLVILKDPKNIIKKHKIIIIFYCLWVIFILISLGGFFKPYRIVSHIPNFPFRAPARFTIIAAFCASALSAIGFSKITEKLKKPVQFLLFVAVIASIIIQQQKLFQGYFNFKNSQEVEKTLQNISSYQMATPLSLKENKSDLPATFQKEFEKGLVISLLGLILLLGWYAKEKST